MTRVLLFAASFFLLTSAFAQTAAAPPPKPSRTPYFIDPTLINLSLLIPPPPMRDSAITQSELSELHRSEQTRTPGQISAAKFDDTHEDIFIYSNVLGPTFTPETLPITAAFSAHIRNDAGVVDPPLKNLYSRPRPFISDTTLHPVCEAKPEGSYPSGHSLNGYLYAYALAEIVPEKHAEILARADDYAHNRIVCGVHYPSDLEASRRAASIVFGYMLANPRFQHELAAAREETRHHLNLQ
jgi:acid phosphatase (class A)